jgi:hypothetical protein
MCSHLDYSCFPTVPYLPHNNHSRCMIMTDWHERALYCLGNNGICFSTHASVAAAETSQAKPSQDKPSPPRTSVVYRVPQRPVVSYRCWCYPRSYVALSVVELFCVWEGLLSPVLCQFCVGCALSGRMRSV